VALTITDQTTTFHDDKVTDHSVFPNFVPLERPLLKSVQENRNHSLMDFLGRPTSVASGILTTAQVAGALLVAIDLPDSLLALPMYREKTRGFLNFRATVNLRFQANAQRFQQGRLFISYFPQMTLNPKKASIVNASITLSTQLPHVDFDLATDSDVALSVPYVSTTTGFNQMDLTGTMGTYQVRVYSPLVSPGGPATVDWSLWCWFTDVELDFPAFTAQSSRPPKRGRQINKITASESEAKAANNGPISGIASRVAKAATLFKDVPLISSIAGTTEWVASMISNGAAAFGWSNPNAQNNVHFSKLNLANDICNVNAIGVNTSMGLLSDNAVAPLPGFAGTDIDEMSFNYLSAIPSYVTAFTLNTTDTYGQIKYAIDLCPWKMGSYSPSNLDMFYPTPLAYIANFFQYWRTGFTFTFKFVKTEFHSGRYAVVFAPGAITNPAWSETAYLYREILDLRESNEFTVTIPYTATLPYLAHEDRGASQLYTVNGQTMGRLVVYALNPLVAPSTVSPAVNCLIEVCADNTFEVAMPRIIADPPTFYVPGTGAPSIVAPGGDEEEVVFEAQALGEDVQDKEKNTTYLIGAPSITGMPNEDGGIESAAHCIGEKVQSFRTLAKRAAPYYTVARADGNEDISFRPKIVSLTNKSDNVTVPAVTGMDYVSMIAPLYNYQRGSLKFFVYTPLTTNQYLRVAMGQNRSTTAPVIIGGTPNTINLNPLAIATGPPISGGLAFYVPQYARTQSEMYRLYTSTYTQAADPYCSDLRVCIRSETATVGGMRILRQAGDDWSCGFFTGCLPLDKAGTYNTTIAQF
jgi:hypothetical protein